MVLYLFFLVSVLLFGSFLIGPLTGRVWVVIIMFFYLLFSSMKNKVYKKNVYINYFLVYIVFLLLAQVMNGDMESYGIKWVLANHFVCIVAFVATIYFTKFNIQSRIDVIIITIMGLLVIDSIVTIMQYRNESLGWAINLFLMQGRNEEIVAFQESRQMLETLAGVAKAPGIFDSSVENGLFLGSCSILPFYFFLRNSKIMKVITLTVMCLSMLACFMCQERAAMLVLLVSVFYLYFKAFNRNAKWTTLVLISVIAIILILIIDFSIVNFGRYEEVGMFSNEARKSIWSNAIPFISDNLVWGGVAHFRSITGSLPHNFFFNSFVFSGLLGGITIITLFIMIAYKGCRLVTLRKTNNTTRVLAMALLAVLTQSLVHNASIITGDVLTFLLFGLMVSSEGITKQGRIELSKGRNL